jgi:hypothetical protein
MSQVLIHANWVRLFHYPKKQSIPVHSSSLYQNILILQGPIEKFHALVHLWGTRSFMLDR